MPYFTTILKGSSIEKPLDLENLWNESLEKNLSITRLISLIIREKVSFWFLQNFIQNQENLKSSEDLEMKVNNFLSLILEIFVSSELAHEVLTDETSELLERAKPMIMKLQNVDCYMDIYSQLTEIYSALSHKSGVKKINSPVSYILWGQALLKLARSYFVPQGHQELGKNEYNEILRLANQKFDYCLDLIAINSRNLPIQLKEDTYKIVATHALNGLGYINLLKARATHDKTTKRSFLLHAKKFFLECEKNFYPSQNSTYNLACVCSLLEQDSEAEDWFQLCKNDGNLPNDMHIHKDTDLDNLKISSKISALFPYPIPSPAVLEQPPISVVPKQSPSPLPEITVVKDEPPLKISEPKGNNSSGDSTGIKYSDDPDLNAAITYDQELNKLQASLLREGFSMSIVIGMVTEVGKAKKKFEIDNAKNEDNRNRLNERLKLCKLKEKRVIPGDGNCQFASISDQLYNDIDRASEIRKDAITWLLQNRNWKLSNGASMSDFAHDQSWDEFCAELARNGIWGNHLTLVAVCEHYGIPITVISSIEGESYLINIEPKVKKSSKIILLSHYAEYHYGSVAKE